MTAPFAARRVAERQAAAERGGARRPVLLVPRRAAVPRGPAARGGHVGGRVVGVAALHLTATIMSGLFAFSFVLVNFGQQSGFR